MRPPLGRSTGVSEAIAVPASQVPDDAAVAFDELYRSSRDDLYAYVAGLVGSGAAAEDVTAATFERAYRKRRRYDPARGSRRAWLFGIARNAALDELRRRGRHTALEADPPDAEATAPEVGAEAAVRRAALRSALGELSPRERELVALKFFAGLTNAEIAAVVGVSETNAGTRLHRVVEKLRRSCDEAA